jgi:hypothetical protein
MSDVEIDICMYGWLWNMMDALIYILLVLLDHGSTSKAIQSDRHAELYSHNSPKVCGHKGSSVAMAV